MIAALSNGNYVVVSPNWDNGGIVDAGAVTWVNGSGSVTATVTETNSLVGSQANDQIGSKGVTILSNGNYVVSSPNWDDAGITDVGAVTWGNGTSGVSGVVSVTNSLIGKTIDDGVGILGVEALSNGNYVVRSPNWDDAGIANVGAATWGNGTDGIKGMVSVTNSLVGSTADDRVGQSVTSLSDGNYLVSSNLWNNGTVDNAGAITWGSGMSGVSGLVSAANSLVGSQAVDRVGYDSTEVLDKGMFVVSSPFWDNGGIINAGAVTWGFGVGGIYGSISSANSVLGLAAGGGLGMVYEYDAVNRQLVVGRPGENIVTLFRLPYVFLPVVRK